MDNFVDIIRECVESFPDNEKNKLIEYIFSCTSDNCIAAVFGMPGMDGVKIQDKLLDNMGNLGLVRPLLNLVTKVKIADVDNPARWGQVLEIAEEACVLSRINNSTSKPKELQGLFKTQPILQGMFLLECLTAHDFPDRMVASI